MTIVSLFFYNELMKMKRPSIGQTDDHEPKEREHYEDDDEPNDEDDYRE
jgi:hypothetical protein